MTADVSDESTAAGHVTALEDSGPPTSPPPMFDESSPSTDEVSISAVRAASLKPVWLDRDLGWIEFNRRVLAEALDDRTPLLERVKFLAIFTSNLDEFFMKRIAILREHLTPERRQLIAQIRDRLLPMLQQQAEYFLGRIVPELSARHPSAAVGRAHCGATARSRGVLRRAGLAALTPLVIQPAAAVSVLLEPLAVTGVSPARRAHRRTDRRPGEGPRRARAVGARVRRTSHRASSCSCDCTT